jgi:cell division protein FtsL
VLLLLLPAAFLFLLFAAVGIVHVTSRVMVVDAGYRLSRLQQENHELTHANDTLRLELATLKSPLRLERLAREQLGMAPPSAAAVVSLGAASRPARPEQARAPRTERALR